MELMICKCKKYRVRFCEIKKENSCSKKQELLNMAIDMQNNGFRVNPYEIKKTYHLACEAETSLCNLEPIRITPE
jgi:hypothetical protein